MSIRKSNTKKNIKPTSIIEYPVKLLGQEYIKIYKPNDVSSYSRFLVPPSSPKEVYFDNTIAPLPHSFPKMKDLHLPKVRMTGVTTAIATLAPYFKCQEFKLNLLQFWFLDMLTDCLWRVQDDYQFPDEQQKVILEWVLYFFNLIRATNMNLSRKKLLRIFNEAIYLAENLVEAGEGHIPLPDGLFTINAVALDEGGGDCDSLSSEQFLRDQEEYLLITNDKETELYKLPKRTGYLNIEDKCLSSSEESEGSSNENIQELLDNENIQELDNDEPQDSEPTECDEDDYRNFYKPDMSTPPRFKSSETLSEESEISSETITESHLQSSKEAVRGEPVWKLVPRKLPIGPCPSRVFEEDLEDKYNQPTETEREAIVLQAWYEYHLWQLRKEDLENEKNSTAEFSEEMLENSDNDELDELQKAFVNELKNQSVERKKIEEDLFINSCVLMAIKEFFVDYFFEPFQFDLIRLAYKQRHYLLTQDLNKEWMIPKLFKAEIKRPPSKKKKKGKIKEIKEKKGKKEKKEKKGKDKDKKGKKSTKSSAKTDDTGKSDKKKGKDKGKKKKEDKESKKSDKAGKKEKESKKSKKSKAGSKVEGKDKKKERKNKKGHLKDDGLVAETLIQSISKNTEKTRLLTEQLQREAEERKKEEENRKFIFPLTNAVDDHFFEQIFEDWTKLPPKGKKGITQDQSDKEHDLKANKQKKKGSEKSSKKKENTGRKKKKRMFI